MNKRGGKKEEGFRQQEQHMLRDESSLQRSRRLGREPHMEASREQKIILYSSLVLQDHSVQMRGLRDSD